MLYKKFLILYNIKWLYLCNLTICLHSSTPAMCKRVLCCPKTPVRLWGPPSFVFGGQQGLFLAEEWNLPFTSNRCRG